jgi:surface antigen
MPTHNHHPNRKPIRTLTSLGAGALLLACAGSALASNLSFLDNTPLAYIQPRDHDEIIKAVYVALDSKQDGQTANWTNQGSRNSVRIDAKITPHDTTKDGEKTCRKVDVELDAKGQSMTLVPSYCREGKGEWQFQKAR